MKLVKATKTSILLELTGGDMTWNSIIFSISLIPDRPIPRHLVIQKIEWSRRRIWSMSWKKFMKETCIGDLCLISRDHFSYRSERTTT